jgi:hypothetical protein
MMVHVPAATSLTVLPLRVHTVVVVVANVTGSPDDAVAVNVNGDCARVAVGRAANVIVWVTAFTVKLRVTFAAAL